MKKSLCLLLSLLLVVLCLVGCDKTPTVDKSTENNQTSNVIEEKPNGLFGNKTDFNTEVYRVPMTDIYIDLPSAPYHLVEMGFTKAAFIYDEQCISMTDNAGITSKDLKAVNQSNIEKLTQNMSNQFKIERLNISNEETVTINGTEMYRFEGELICSKTAGEYSQYVVGYTFIKDGTPCSLIGTVLNKYEIQPESVEKDVEEKVDVLIKTLRSEP